MTIPRQMIRRGAKVWLVFTILFFVCFAGPCNFRTNYILAKDAQETTAVLTEKHQHGMFDYNYTVDHHEYTGSDQRNWEQEKYRNVQVGEESVVFYSVSHPWISSLQTPRFPPRDTLFYVGPPFIFGLAIMLIAYFGKSEKPKEQ